MERSALHLAALASAAVPGLDPVLVEPARQGEQCRYDVAFLKDTRDRRWVLRAPRSAGAAAQLASASRLLELLSKRLSVTLPVPRGEAASRDGHAIAYTYIPGHNVDLAELPSGPGLAAEIGRTLAHIHNVDLAVCEEAGIVTYTAEEHRSRRLTDLDRASDTGQVPSSLLARWEAQLENVRYWRFAPTLVHGRFGGERIIVQFDDDDDASTGHVRGVTGWEECHVGDPADDLRAFAAECSDETLETVVEAYSYTRVEQPDPYLVRRARLSAEMTGLSELLSAHSRGDTRRVQMLAAQLRELETYLEQVEGQEPLDGFEDVDALRASGSYAASPDTGAFSRERWEGEDSDEWGDEQPEGEADGDWLETTQNISPDEMGWDDEAGDEADGLQETQPHVAFADDDDELVEVAGEDRGHGGHGGRDAAVPQVVEDDVDVSFEEELDLAFAESATRREPEPPSAPPAAIEDEPDDEDDIVSPKDRRPQRPIIKGLEAVRHEHDDEAGVDGEAGRADGAGDGEDLGEDFDEEPVDDESIDDESVEDESGDDEASDDESGDDVPHPDDPDGPAVDTGEGASEFVAVKPRRRFFGR